MKWYVFISEYGHVFTGNTEEEVIEFIVERLENDYGFEPEEEACYIIKGKEYSFVPPSSKGTLAECSR